MTKRPKPAKGVPMPDLDYIECYWAETPEGIEPGAILRPSTLDCLKVNELRKQIAEANKWLANPATPKGVRR